MLTVLDWVVLGTLGISFLALIYWFCWLLYKDMKDSEGLYKEGRNKIK